MVLIVTAAAYDIYYIAIAVICFLTVKPQIRLTSLFKLGETVMQKYFSPPGVVKPKIKKLNIKIPHILV